MPFQTLKVVNKCNKDTNKNKKEMRSSIEKAKKPVKLKIKDSQRKYI